jgi:hypothetical protein
VRRRWLGWRPPVAEPRVGWSRRLPAAFEAIEVGEWNSLSAADARLSRHVADPATMLVYSRRGTRSYDEIAERVGASTPPDMTAGLTDRLTMRFHQERALRVRRPLALEVIRREQDLLSHRPLDLTVDGHHSYVVSGDEIAIGVEGSPVTWRFALSYPPRLLADTIDDDVAEPTAWHVLLPKTGLWWLPLDGLIRQARLVRWQDLGGELVATIRPGQLPVFISHRWLAVDQPDPKGRQARLIAWHLLAAIGEAANIAEARGLHEPRRRSTIVDHCVGIEGSELAEACLVALLRPTVDIGMLGELVAETRSIEELVDDDLVSFAEADEGLAEMRGLLERCPLLAELMSRIHLWIDYCCLPQPPRTEPEQAEFMAGLRLLNTAQLLGLTVILLDAVEDYTRRAWCLLEAITAYRLVGNYEVLSGLPENTDPLGGPYTHLSDLLLDLPQLVWRAILDTELFGVIDWREAMTRLDISVTDPDDLPFIYDLLRAIPAPNRLHTLVGDLVTGVFPLPQTSAGRALAPSELGATVAEPPREQIVPLPWADVLNLSTRGAVGKTSGTSAAARQPFVKWRKAAHGRPKAHVAIVASCEGEAVLIADWVDTHRAELEATCGVTVSSRSWLADDVAPVGTLVYGWLARARVTAPNWIIVTQSVRRRHCSVTAALVKTARDAGRAVAWALLGEEPHVVTEAGFPARSLKSEAERGDAPQVRLGPRDRRVLGGVYREDLIAFLGGDPGA